MWVPKCREYQHGQIGSGQPEYNFAPAVLSSEEYRRTLPDYFLSYGSWWTDRINAPINPVVIGNPHRSESLPSMRNVTAPGDRLDVLVIAKLGDTARYLGLARDIDRCTGGELKVGFRPNPRDLAPISEAADQGRIGRIDVDRNRDVYPSLARADAVVSGPSTTLVEALGIARRVFIWEEAGAAFKYPDPIFERFSTAAELVDKLNSHVDQSVHRPASEDVCASNWRERYGAFVAPFLR
jgi:hypothetical protein